MPTLAVARLWFEGNRFSPLPTGMAQFAAREWQCGAAAIDAARGTATELAGVGDVLAAHPHWRAEVLRCASANPGGPIEHALFESFCAEVIAGLAALQPAAVYLSLHGAAITSRTDTPDLDLVTQVRTLLPGVPLAASFDFHANLPVRMVEQLDYATGYRTYPHIDMRETAVRTVARLLAIAGGAPRPRGRLLQLGLRLPSFNMRTDTAPMAPLLAAARSLEQADPRARLDVSLVGGFPYADTADTGASVMAWANEQEVADAACTALSQQWRACAGAFTPVLVIPEQGLLRAAALLTAQAADALRPVALTDPADNPLSGGAADTPALLRALLAARRNAASPLAALRPGDIVFAYFTDPDAVRLARSAGVGAMLSLHLGARLDQRFGAPVALDARVLLLTDGNFHNTGPMEHGSRVTLGDTALLDVDGIHLVITSQTGAANDPGFFALHGIDPERVRLLCVKAKNHFHAAFAPLCAAIIDVDCPGPAAADVASLPGYRGLR